jgi:cytochrome c oxidase subunit 2
MISWYIPRASSYANDIDLLIDVITVLVGFWFIVSEVAFFWFLWRYRHRKGQTRAMYVTGEEHEYARWIHWPHYAIIACDLVIIGGAVRVWYNVKQDLPPADATIRVIVQQWAWTFVQPGADGKLDTPDDIRTIDELHVEVGKTYHYELTSLDVLHDFSVPVFRLKQDAIPGRVIKGWFQPTKTGVHDIQCAEICGVGHGIMNATIYIESEADHDAWIQAHPVATAALPSASTGGIAALEPRGE